VATLLNFSSVYISIPRKSILKDLEKRYLNSKTLVKYRKFKKEIFKAQSKLAQLDSTIDRILLKSID